MRDGEIAEIDGLRGIAIVLVMVHRLWPRSSAGLVEVGWIGVDLFFVVSGFLITRILLATRDEPAYFRNFYARRVLRIFPLYYLFVGGMLLVGSADMHRAAGSSAWYLLFLGNVPEGLLGRDPPYWLAPVWSLAIEEQFYLTFPHVVRRLDPRRLARVLAGLIVLAPLLRAAAVLEWPGRERIEYLATPCRLDAIAAGCLLAIVATAPRFAALRRPLALVAVAAAAIAVATGLDRTTAFGRIAGYSVVAIGFAALTGVVLLSGGARAIAFLRVRGLRYLGRLCFGLYLLHRPADTLTTVAAARLGLDASEGVAWVAVKIAVAVALASLSWFALERPLLRLKRRFASPAHPLAAIALTAGCSFHTGGSGGEATGDAAPVHIAIDAPVPLGGLAVYTFDRTQSPITPSIAQYLKAITAPGRADEVFAKVGDSITALPDFVTCFDGGHYDLGAHPELAEPLAYYLRGDAAGTSPFARTSEAATGGWTAADVLAGPLDAELSAIAPRTAVILIGTNDNRYGRSLAAYGADLWTIVDRTIASGTIPLVSTLPPIHSDPTTDARVPLFGLVARAIAQGRQIPLVDFYREMLPLPGQGLASDGIHPSTSPDGACFLGDLEYGFDVRNLITLEQLARVRTALAGNAPDASAPLRAGSGTASDPIRASLPLADLPDLRTGDAADSLCLPMTGHQVTYALTGPATFDAYAFTRDGSEAPLDVRVAGGCLTAGWGEVTAGVPPGTAYLVVGGDDEVVVIAAAR
jgi:peptidoglycan/LPS O-acetylase OafA/YrhL